MSLRTKILAAVVGLNLLVLLLGVLVPLVGMPGERGVPARTWQLLTRVEASPGTGSDAGSVRARALRDLYEQGEGVEAVVLLQERADDKTATPEPVLDPAGPPVPDRADVERAVRLHRRARLENRGQVRDGELLALLEGGASPASEDAPVAGRQSVWVRWSPGGSELGRVRVLYFTLLAGIAAVSLVAWLLLSRLVVRPLGALADAASKAAAGDMSARVPVSGAGDEFDRTAVAFNRMALEIAEYQGQLEARVMEALTRVRKAEQHLMVAQRLAATGKLASGIAHEINNPLGGMRNAVRALQRGDLSAEKTSEYLALVQDGLGRVEDTVKKVLAFTPRGASPRPTDLAEAVRKAGALARHRTERRGIRYVESLPEDGPVVVFGDPNELQQVALNLLLNAADAIPERPERGTVEVEVRADGDAAVLEVRDDGVGMSPEVASQCFDLFFTTKEVGEGTGLGLAVAHNVVTNHGGRIEVESTPGRGSTFRVVLPREPAGPPGPHGGAAERAAADGTAPGP